jgi:hypothetical protein
MYDDDDDEKERQELHWLAMCNQAQNPYLKRIVTKEEYDRMVELGIPTERVIVLDDIRRVRHGVDNSDIQKGRVGGICMESDKSGESRSGGGMAVLQETHDSGGGASGVCNGNDSNDFCPW